MTDANLLLGYLDPQAELPGGVSLDLQAAREVIGRLADALGLSEGECAEGIVAVANAEMVRALRVVTVQRGIDPRGYALMAFGGAGGLHAAAMARELGIKKILCARAAGVLAALGLVVSPRRRDVQRSVLLSGDELTAEAVAETVDELGERASSALGADDAELRVVYELRYRGQAFELAIAGGLRAGPEDLRRDFEREHEERYGYNDPEQTLELVTIRVTATAGGADVDLSAGGAPAPERRSRKARIAGEELEFEVLRGAPAPGTSIAGPTLVELPESTLLVPPGWSGAVEETGTIVLECEQ